MNEDEPTIDDVAMVAEPEPETDAFFIDPVANGLEDAPDWLTQFVSEEADLLGKAVDASKARAYRTATIAAARMAATLREPPPAS